jgi:hypothetical protein
VHGRTPPRPLGVVERIAMCVVALALTGVSLAHKLSCTGPLGTDSWAVHVSRTACYSDTASLFTSRDLARHVLPYVHGWFTADPPTLHGGTVEYPTLTGLWVWLTALPVSTVQGFLVVTALSFVPAVVVVVLGLQRLAGRRAWIWSATPPLALYALYNWDVLPVAATVAGLVLALRPPRRWSPTLAAVLAGALFGVGGAFKLYPVMFVVPLALASLLDRGSAVRWPRAVGSVGGAVAVVVAANLPFALVHPAGWLSVFEFQAARPIDGTTLSIWSVVVTPFLHGDAATEQHALGLASTLSTAVGILVVLAVGIVLGVRSGTMPWVQTGAAMLCVYMLCNKVHSLQYVLWLLPFLAVVRIRAGWIAAYLVADLATFVGWFRQTYYHALGNQSATWADHLLTVGVGGRAVLLVVLAVLFLRSSLAPTGRGDLAGSPRSYTDAYARMDR